jgi:hypothetical protein
VPRLDSVHFDIQSSIKETSTSNKGSDYGGSFVPADEQPQSGNVDGIPFNHREKTNKFPPKDLRTEKITDDESA